MPSRAPFKFIIDDFPVRCMRLFLARESRQGHIPQFEEILKREFDLVMCDPPEGLPARENGKYWVRTGRGQHQSYRYLLGVWWTHPRGDTYDLTELKPTIVFSQAELQAIQGMLRVGRREWLSEHAQELLRLYIDQQHLRFTYRQGRRSMVRLNKFRKERGI